MAYRIWCRVSGGMTGTNEAWLRDSKTTYASFPTLDEAEAEAARNMIDLGSDGE